MKLFTIEKTKLGGFKQYAPVHYLTATLFFIVALLIHFGMMEWASSLMSTTEATGNISQDQSYTVPPVIADLIKYTGYLIITMMYCHGLVLIKTNLTLFESTLTENIDYLQDEDIDQLRLNSLVDYLACLVHFLGLNNHPDGDSLRNSTAAEMKAFRDLRIKLFDKIKAREDLAKMPLSDVMNLKLTDEQKQYLKDI